MGDEDRTGPGALVLADDAVLLELVDETAGTGIAVAGRRIIRSVSYVFIVHHSLFTRDVFHISLKCVPQSRTVSVLFLIFFLSHS